MRRTGHGVEVHQHERHSPADRGEGHGERGVPADRDDDRGTPASDERLREEERGD
jgi:hypothetical protein